MNYVIQSRNKFTGIESLFYGGSRFSLQRYIVHEEAQFNKKEIEEQFVRACTLFAGQVQSLGLIDRELTEYEKKTLISSLEGLLELHALLKGK